MELATGSICRACRGRMSKTPQWRPFSTSSRKTSIPPESPHYVDVPLSHQANHYTPRRVKGILPVPRELFPARRPDKPSEEYLRNATKDPKIPVDLSKLEGLSLYKAQMSLLRKQHLRESLKTLHERKLAHERFVGSRSQAKQVERARLIAEPEREDVRLTSNSTPQSMQPTKNPALSAAEAQDTYETKKANIARRDATKRAERQDALHTLYMSAQKFITTEEQLTQKITEEFDEKDFGGPSHDIGKNYWSLAGAPDTVKQMVSQTFTSPRQEKGVHLDEAFRKDQKRMKRIAEKLSGGKI